MKFISIRAVTIPSTILLFARYGRASSTPSHLERLRRVRDRSPYKSGINDDTPHSNQRTQEHDHRRVLQDDGSSSLPLSTTDNPAEWSPFEPDPVISPLEETTVGGTSGTKTSDDVSSCCCGLSYCPSSGACIQPWAETCPIAGGGTAFEGPMTVWCEAGIGQCSSSMDAGECTWTQGSATMGTYYFADLEGEFEVPEGCNLDCAGCTTVDDTAGVPDNGVSLFSVGDVDEPNVLVNNVSLFQVGDEDEPYDPFLGIGGDEEGSTLEEKDKGLMSMPMTTSMSMPMTTSMSMPMTTTASSSTPDVNPQSGTASSTGGGGEEDDGAYQSNRDAYESALAGGEQDGGGFNAPSGFTTDDSSPSARMGISLVVVALISTLTGLQLLV